MTADLVAAGPRYVSTVDSGNLLAALLAVQAYFPALSETAGRLTDGTDMAALLDAERNLTNLTAVITICSVRRP